MNKDEKQRRWVFVVGLFALATPPALAQAPPTDLARQHLESGIQFYEQQRYKQALNDFQIIVTSMADTEYADDALLRIGRYYLDVEEDFRTAREHFDEVLTNYPTGNAAPGAYYYLGEVLLRSDRGGRAIDDALANFQRVFLYPGNPWTPAALYSTGLALERQGSYQKAVDTYYQVVIEHPGSDWAAGAQLGVGRSSVRQGDPVEAMVQFQEVRNRYPDSREAEAALDWLTLLFRFYGAPILGRPVTFRHDSSFRAALADDFDDVKAVRLSRSGIHVLERGKKRVLTFDDSGKLAGSQRTVDPYGLSVDPRGELIVANDKGVVIGGQPTVFRIPSEEGPEQLEQIRWAARDRLGDVFVYDDSEKRVFRFNDAGELVGTFPDATRRKVLVIEIDQLGNIIFLEERDREVRVYASDGRPVARIETERGQWKLDKAADIALDPAGYLYILDEDQGRIAVFDASYQFVTMLNQQTLGQGVLDDPKSLDVDASGALYVYDDDQKKIVRLH